MELKDLDYDLGIMHVLYGLAFAFGFQELATSLDRLISGAEGFSSTATTIGILSLNFSMILVGLRFFWAIGNLRRFVKRQNNLPPRTQIEIVVVHFPIVVLQSFAFYLLCAQIPRILDQPPDVVGIPRVGHFAAFLLFSNSIWLAILQRGVPKHSPERTWFVNNLGMACIILVVLFSFRDQFLEMWGVTFTLAANSIVDLGLTSKWYLKSAPNLKDKSARASA